MSCKRELPPLEVHQDLKFQEREWRIQRIGWLALAAFLLAGLCGLFGPGLFNGASAEGQAISVEFSRFDRQFSPSTLKIQLFSEGDDESQQTLSIDRSLLESIEIQRITPEPSSVSNQKNQVQYHFEIDGDMDKLDVMVHYQSTSIGMVSGHLRNNDNTSTPVQFFVFP